MSTLGPIVDCNVHLWDLGDPAAEGFADLVHRLRGNLGRVACGGPAAAGEGANPYPEGQAGRRRDQGDREMLLRAAAERWSSPASRRRVRPDSERTSSEVRVTGGVHAQRRRA